jgi:hypothetical protein
MIQIDISICSKNWEFASKSMEGDFNESLSPFFGSIIAQRSLLGAVVVEVSPHWIEADELATVAVFRRMAVWRWLCW